MDEERKTPATHDEMCFPDWLNEAHGIKGVNQPLRCLGSTWAGLLMRQKWARLGLRGGLQTSILRRLRRRPDLWPRPRSQRGQGGVIFTRPHCSPFKSKAALRKWKKGLFWRYNQSESCREPQTEVAWSSVSSKCHLSPPLLAHVSSSSSPYPHVCCPWLPRELAHHRHFGNPCCAGFDQSSESYILGKVRWERLMDDWATAIKSRPGGVVGTQARKNKMGILNASLLVIYENLDATVSRPAGARMDTAWDSWASVSSSI